jgi:hypothetical protein
MKNFIKIAAGWNVTSLALEIHQHPELWNVDKERLSEAGPHRDSDDMWIRLNDKTPFVESGDWSDFNSEHESIWYPAYYALPSIRKLVFDLARCVEAERIGDVILWRVKPGHKIHKHIDRSWHVDYYDKFNICIQSSPGAAFVYDDESIRDNPGDVHRFVNNVPHGVVNESDQDYIVMVVCLRTHDYERRFKRENLGRGTERDALLPDSREPGVHEENESLCGDGDWVA